MEAVSEAKVALPENEKVIKLSEVQPLKLFREPRLFLTHGGQTIRVLMRAVVTYYRPTRYVRSKKQKEKKEETRKIDGFLEIDTGEEWNKWMLENRQGRINKAINQLILFEYDKNRPIRAWLKKKFRQDGGNRG